MPFAAALQMTPVKLMDALGGDGAAFFTGQRGGNFLPRLAPLAMFADEIHERSEPAVKSASAAGSLTLHRMLVVDDFWIHLRTA